MCTNPLTAQETRVGLSTSRRVGLDHIVTCKIATRHELSGTHGVCVRRRQNGRPRLQALLTAHVYNLFQAAFSGQQTHRRVGVPSAQKILADAESWLHQDPESDAEAGAAPSFLLQLPRKPPAAAASEPPPMQPMHPMQQMRPMRPMQPAFPQQILSDAPAAADASAPQGQPTGAKAALDIAQQVMSEPRPAVAAVSGQELCCCCVLVMAADCNPLYCVRHNRRTQSGYWQASGRSMLLVCHLYHHSFWHAVAGAGRPHVVPDARLPGRRAGVSPGMLS